MSGATAISLQSASPPTPPLHPTLHGAPRLTLIRIIASLIHTILQVIASVLVSGIGLLASALAIVLLAAVLGAGGFSGIEALRGIRRRRKPGKPDDPPS